LLFPFKRLVSFVEHFYYGVRRVSLYLPHPSHCQLPAADSRYTHTAILKRLSFLGDLLSHWSLHLYIVSINLLCLILSIFLSSLPLFLCLSHLPGLLNMMTGEHELSVRHSAAAPPCFWHVNNGAQGSLTNTCKFEANFHLRERRKFYRDAQSVFETEILLFLGSVNFLF
jgi:hypothetical protein